MSKATDTPSLIGKLIASLVGNGLLVWAMLETDGLLHAVLIGYLAFLAIAAIVAVSVNEATKAGATRPIYGDVHVRAHNLDGLK